MTILSKDFGQEVITVTGGTAGNDGSTGTNVYDINSPNAGPNAQEPPTNWSTFGNAIMPNGRANYNRSEWPKGIYLAWSSEFDTWALPQCGYPVTVNGVIISYNRTEGFNICINKKLKSAGLGSPLYVFPGGHYIARWYGPAGLGIYTFVGYVAGSGPTQSMTFAPESGTESTDDASSENTGIAEDEEEDAARVVILGDGYGDDDFGIPGIPGTDGYFTTVPYSGGTTVTVTTTVPASSGATGTVGTYTYQQIIKITKRGWNSWARSINPLAAGKYILFKTGSGISGCMMGIAPAGWEGKPPSAFHYSIIVDQSGVKVHELGQLKSTLRASFSKNSELRIYRHSDNTIHYAIKTGTQTVVYESNVECPFPLSVSLYVYGYLYTSGDKVVSASFSSGEIVYGEITFDGESDIEIYDYEVLFNAESGLTIEESEEITFDCESNFYVEDSNDYIYATFPRMGSIVMEQELSFGTVNAQFPLMQAEVEGGEYTPPDLEYIFAVFPPLTGYCKVLTSSPITINATFPNMLGSAYDDDYGAVNATFPDMIGRAYDDPNPGVAPAISVAYAYGGAVANQQHIVIINEIGQIVDTYSASVIEIASIIVQIQESDTYSVIGTYVAEAISTASILDSVTAAIGDMAALDDNGRVWVVNMDTEASGQYDNYGFYDFIEKDGICYGFANDGIYKLSGDTDNGNPIDCLVDFGRSNYGDRRLKKVGDVYVGVGTDGTVYLKTVTDGVINIYAMRTSSTDIRDHRADVDPYLRGNHWNFYLVNHNGSDFELSSIEFKIISLSGDY